MMRLRLDTTYLAALVVTAGLWLVAGCDDGEEPEPDAGSAPMDAGCPTPPELPEEREPADPSTITCPDDPTTTPAPEEQMGTCCWRHDNAGGDTPEFRLTFIDIVAPLGSPLSGTDIRRVLNESVQEETFTWLMRVEDAAADGPVNIVTGFGRRTSAGTYEFSQGSAGPEGDPDEWCPIEVPAALTGDTIASDSIEGSITVPIFNDAGDMVQAELTLRNIAVAEAHWREDRNCVGWKIGRPFTYVPQAVLTGYVEVETARGQQIMQPGVTTSVCSALAGSLSLTYCDDTDQADWNIQPDALCDASGCRANAPCESDVCDPATTCNAWRFVAHFAASAVDITNDVCPAM